MKDHGMSEAMGGLKIIAVGISLPELVTCVAVKQAKDLCA
jgi:hypothetical protein